MSPHGGWFSFAVVRDPRKRLFSAWQNKLLLDNPEYTRFKNEPWYPRHPASTATIVEDFRSFVEMLDLDRSHTLLVDDGHFRSQSSMLMDDVFEYTRIYDLGEIPSLIDDLRGHLRTLGHNADVCLPRFNDTPLQPTRDVFSNGVDDRIVELYRTDFDVLPHDWPQELDLESATWSFGQLAEIELRAAHGRRIADLLTRAKRLRKRLDEVEAKLAGLGESDQS
jgi:hypothetical protein